MGTERTLTEAVDISNSVADVLASEPGAASGGDMTIHLVDEQAE